jgi:hypothetical protein
MSAMSCLRPETCAKLAASLASCLAVACENMANQDRCGTTGLDCRWLRSRAMQCMLLSFSS